MGFHWDLASTRMPKSLRDTHPHKRAKGPHRFRLFCNAYDW